MSPPFVQVAWPTGGGSFVDANVTARTAANADSYFAQVTPGTYAEANKSYMPYNTQSCLTFARFQLNIPKDATITLAEFTWWCSRYPSNALESPADDMTVACEQADSAAQISDRTTLLSRFTDAGATTVTWSSDVTINESNPHTSDDLKTIVQQIVNRAGWVSGNYLGLFIEHAGSGTSDSVAWWLHAGGNASGYHPRLYVEYRYTP